MVRTFRTAFSMDLSIEKLTDFGAGVRLAMGDPGLTYALRDDTACHEFDSGREEASGKNGVW